MRQTTGISIMTMPPKGGEEERHNDDDDDVALDWQTEREREKERKRGRQQSGTGTERISVSNFKKADKLTSSDTRITPPSR